MSEINIFIHYPSLPESGQNGKILFASSRFWHDSGTYSDAAMLESKTLKYQNN